MPYYINILYKSSISPKKSGQMQVLPHYSIGFVKMMLVMKREAVRPQDLCMTFAGRPLDDSKTVSECGIINFNSITVFRKVRGGGKRPRME